MSFRYSYEYQIPLGDLNPERVDSGKGGWSLGSDTGISAMVSFFTTGDKKALTQTKLINRYRRGREQVFGDFGRPITTNESYAQFYVSDDEIAKRLVNAFKDLIAQCGGEPDKKEIY